MSIKKSRYIHDHPQGIFRLWMIDIIGGALFLLFLASSVTLFFVGLGDHPLQWILNHV